VSSTISVSACAVIGVLEWPAVGSSFANSPLVELTTFKYKINSKKLKIFNKIIIIMD